MNRREFLKTASIAAAAATAAPARAAEARAKLHAFSKPLDWLEVDPLAESMAEAGFNGIDFTVRPKGRIEPERVTTDLPRAVEAARKQGLAVGMMVTAISSAADPDAERVLKTAAQCGVKVYRMGYLQYDFSLGIEGSIEKLRRELAALEALNRKCGIKGGYQNHFANREGQFGGPVWDVALALKGLDPQWIGSQYDVRHAVAETFGSWSLGLRLIAPHIGSICLKDFSWGTRKDRVVPDNRFAGEGLVPWDRYFKLLKELGISVPATVHCEWDLFTEEEKALPEPERRVIAVKKLKRNADFFAESFARHGLTT